MKFEMVFGIHAVTTLLSRDPERVKKLFVVQGRLDQKIESILDLAAGQGISVERVNKNRLDDRVQGVHQGVVAEVKPMPQLGDKELDNLLDQISGTPLLLVLDGVTDPHNLGACLRTADAAGVHAVIAPRDKSAPLNATASKVACGAAEAIPYFQVTNLSRTLTQLQERGIWIVGTAGEADATIYQSDLKGPLALVMGAEGKGMRRLTRENCDLLINIPMAGEVSSLNVSVATGVTLFEIVRQRLS
ncbi:23S rRNA (guanosine(2251)-2'-O)-methyltransferase RlmB [Marinobacterium sp. LSUCC0821]|uniref:23S rRNA (guanosine(2251)-2'-O)-methyltransferase RlmB n=1 Tax=Marinobacterium sp. LSUCC0821 TaxID=2668067 RepID=UPI0014515D4E|nr:23S rRNA (guanosine(2251)-2'-O)-methyltransferase RlmB [Marinobacterium sp. LSUCC0821]QJD70347.1 23S rRNA (guanosine(2251)-2'-O)-methyltransferase RlmB [Marinobacterium sp. LSUCC0821]